MYQEGIYNLKVNVKNNIFVFPAQEMSELLISAIKIVPVQISFFIEKFP